MKLWSRNGHGHSNGNGHGDPNAVRRVLQSFARSSAEHPPADSSTASRRTRAAWREWADLRRERNRGRRYERSFTLIRISSPGSDERRRPGRGGPLDAIGDVMRLVRSVDGVWTDERDVYVLLPECDRATGERTLKRIGQSLAKVLPAGAAITLASFPEDGRTSGALLHTLHGVPVDTIEAVPATPAISLVEEILVRTVPLAGADALREIPKDGAEASLT